MQVINLSKTNAGLAYSVAAAAALAVVPTVSSHAGVISFTPPEYPLGTALISNPDWNNAGSGNLFSITSLGGGEGAAQSTTSAESAFSNANFTPDAAFLGGADTTTAGKLVGFSFDLRFDQIGSVDGFRLDHRIIIGGSDGSPVVAFDLFGNSRLQYLTGSGSSNAVNVNDASLNLDDVGTARFLTVEGVIDFDAGTYDLTIDGVEQGTGLTVINNSASFGQVVLQRRTSDAGALQFSFDNLELTVIPEPASLGLMVLGAAAMLPRRRRR